MAVSKEDRLLRWSLEAGALKRLKRTGWWCSGIKDPESVAEHSFRMSLLAAYIASEEGADPCKAGMLGLSHDLPEARIGDAHAVVKRYWTDLAQDEERARCEQNASLPPGPFRDLVGALGREWVAGKTPEARAAKDADYLECAVQALEYLWKEKSVCREWVESNRKRLKTKTGKRLGDRLLELLKKDKWEDFQVWWKDIYHR